MAFIEGFHCTTLDICVIKSSHCNSFDDFIFGWPIFKWIAVTWQGWEGTSIVVLAVATRSTDPIRSHDIIHHSIYSSRTQISPWTHKTPHSLPVRVIHGVSFVSIWEETNIIMAPHSTYLRNLVKQGWLDHSLLPNTHKRHPIACPHGQATGCLLWVFGRKLTVL